MKRYYFKKLNGISLKNLCKRKPICFDDILPVVKNILAEVKNRGDEALLEFTAKFDNINLSSFEITEKEIEESTKRIPQDIQKAFQKAAYNIKKFHKLQLSKPKKIETMDGVYCFTEMRPIEKVGLYIPGGTAPLASTVLMLAIPAKLAGCKEIVLVTPPTKEGKVADIILFSAKLCGITKIFKIGGAQAIAALAFGTESIPKVDKIFGPGNKYVTLAKMLVSIDPEGSAIDMPAGPTEILIIADEKARADFVASDLLSQLEHDTDSIAILVTTSNKKADEILVELKKQMKELPRGEIARKALGNGFIMIVDSIEEAIAFSNQYAPEHLVLNATNPRKYISSIKNAGSVFLGPYSPVSAGDYAVGTNHSLPTYGYARVFGGISVSSFQKIITFQEITKQGAKNLGPIVSIMALQEGLEGHKKAMQLRYETL